MDIRISFPRKKFSINHLKYEKRQEYYIIIQFLLTGNTLLISYKDQPLREF